MTRRVCRESGVCLVFLPGALSPAAAAELTAAALTDYPQPPARTNHSLQYGPIAGLWEAAQRGLRLRWQRLDDPHTGPSRRVGCEHRPPKPHRFPDSRGAEGDEQQRPQQEQPPQEAGSCSAGGGGAGTGADAGGCSSSAAPAVAEPRLAVAAETAAPACGGRCGGRCGGADDGAGGRGEEATAGGSGGGCSGGRALRPGSGPAVEQPSAYGADGGGGDDGRAPQQQEGQQEQPDPGPASCGQGAGSWMEGGLAGAGSPARGSGPAGRGPDGADDGSGAGGRGVGGARNSGGGGTGGGCSGGRVPSFDDCWSVDGPGPPAEQLLRKLRWATLGPQFDWTQRQYDFATPYKRLPPALESLALRLSAVLDVLRWPDQDGAPVGDANAGTDASAREGARAEARAAAGLAPGAGSGRDGGCGCYRPDAAIVNFYQQGDMLGGHLDDVERDLGQPIVSLSLGCPAVFLMGGPTKAVAPTPLLLRGGDALVLAGQARSCYHGVPRILEVGTVESAAEGADGGAPLLPAPLAAYIRSARINISIRAVR
ncbi:hypothetical protein GPECTOR_50g662 [Gonium pectorale]|uniref:Fe2OG dioxygenase domain-containing protein n=1 Tax=Gonium pectorale TaxID=33097 RepID=A0A150G7R7_GONPE|nr:hypothetical protein GPECTOR_50g662 [Gonium pectorale]|eukprot:KXZ45868.1 hypothetical protein GPECTOR_50g662 [Gonium pectorale]